MSRSPHITILGGGPGGLSVGYFAAKIGLPFTLYEGSNRSGGNCFTFRCGDFLFDCGSHRFHAKYPEVTQEIFNLLGNDLRESELPSQIYYDGKLFDFPLSPLNLLRKLGVLTFTKSRIEVACSRVLNRNKNETFRDFVTAKYGKSIARRFLLNYSEKLWGGPSENLSPIIAGGRLSGWSLRTLLIEAFQGRNAKVASLDGKFYYPRLGIGTIAEKLAAACHPNIHTESRITKIFHNQNSIQGVEINRRHRAGVDQLVNTLPLTLFVQMMEPEPPEKITALAKSLRFRDLILAAFFIAKETVTEAGSMYFPDHKFPFTRIYEPKRRSEAMAPHGSTSLVAEIPCQNVDKIWNANDEEVISLVFPKLSDVFGIKANEIIATKVIRVPNAYPVLEKDFEQKVNEIFVFLSSFKNLKVVGRSGTFAYTSIHHMMKFGKEVIDEYLRGPQYSNFSLTT